MTTSRAALLAVLATLSAACATPPRPVVGRPPLPPGVSPEHLHFAVASVTVGDVAPDFDLPTAGDWGSVRLSDLRGRPVVLVFASHT